ncbi:ATP synthase F0 subunit C [uncultured Clostridium sp.]|uniref:ATP synthase F0 subunit C n=1 Tax=uncultured Clostridium sp. TaxID=59620 RepID=UPI002606BC0A|nr:ATP synthase F0 subunit C [uncultured Clostridium sp.]
MGIGLIGVGLAAVTALGAGIGIGIAAKGAVEGIARKPEMYGKIQGMFILGAGLAEATAIYGLIVAILLYFVH